MATTNSFIANVNLLASKLNAVLQAVDLFDENVIPILEEIAALDLNEAINDLKKGNYLGNRKLDINLSYNMEGINENTPEQEASAIWLDSTKTVLYNSATAIFKDGSTVNIPFIYDGNPISISTHADLLTQLNNNENFLNKLDNTLIASFAAPVVGEIIRAYDVLGAASNLERLIIHAVSGSYKEANPSYYWVKTTSALQTLAMRIGDIIQIGNEIDNFILLANSLDSLMELQARIPELIDTFTNGEPNGDVTIYNSLSELMDIYDNLVALQTLYTNLPLLNTVHENLDNINAVNSNASNINTVAINAGDVSVVSENISKVIPVADNISNVNAVANTVVPNMIDILQADDNAQLAKEYANKTTGQVEVNTYSAKEYAIGDSTASGGSAKAWAIDANSPDGTTSKSAKTWAEEASVSATNAANSAITATNKANEIKNVTVGSTSTGVAGTLAAVYYNSGTGQFHFVIPQGIKGDKGDAFTVNAYGTFAQRTLYDAQVKDFSFFATDLGKIYFKNSATSGDWSAGIDFGKGDKGDTGAAGRGITSISFLSSSLGGSAGQLGAVDTYRINYSDATTSTFTVTNGSPTPSAIPAANVTQTSSYRFVTDAEKTTWNSKQNALSRTVDGNDNATGTVSDAGGNISVPIPVTTIAPTASNTQKTAGTTSLRLVVQTILNNLAWLFANKQNSLSRTVISDDNTTASITDTGGNLSIAVPVTTVAATASNTQKTAGTTSLRSVIQTVINNIAYLFANMQTKLSRTVTGKDNATGTVTDTGGNLSIPVPVTTVAPTASATIQAAGTISLRTAIQSILNNLKQIFDTMVTLTGTQTLTDKILEAIRVTEKAFTATGTTGTITVDCANGNKATITPTGNITGWTFNNVPSSDNSYILNIQITGSGTVRGVAYPTSIKWKKDIVPEINWASGRKTFIILETSDGGVSWEGRW